MNYLSPYVIIDGASQGIANGSLFVFAGLFVSSLFVGRLWCSWACPAGGLGEIAFLVNNKPVQGRKIDWIKWLIWVPWISLIVWLVISSGGYHSTNFFLDTVNGISVAGDADRPAFHCLYHLLCCHRSFPHPLADRWKKGRLSHHLLDGAFHDHWSKDP